MKPSIYRTSSLPSLAFLPSKPELKRSQSFSIKDIKNEQDKLLSNSSSFTLLDTKNALSRLSEMKNKILSIYPNSPENAYIREEIETNSAVIHDLLIAESEISISIFKVSSDWDNKTNEQKKMAFKSIECLIRKRTNNKKPYWIESEERLHLNIASLRFEISRLNMNLPPKELSERLLTNGTPCLAHLYNAFLGLNNIKVNRTAKLSSELSKSENLNAMSNELCNGSLQDASSFYAFSIEKGLIGFECNDGSISNQDLVEYCKLATFNLFLFTNDLFKFEGNYPETLDVEDFHKLVLERKL